MSQQTEGEQTGSTLDETQSPDTESESAGLSGLSFTLYMRPAASTVTRERQTRTRERFESLLDIEETESATIERWDKQVTVDGEGTTTDEEIIELFDEFKQETDRVGARLEPFFEERTVVNNFFSQSSKERLLVFPVFCITVRREEDLVGLYPCWRDAVHYSVNDCLNTLEAGGSVTNLT